MALSMTFHTVAKLSAKYLTHDDSSWVELTITDTYGDAVAQTIFFESPALARAYADAINSVVPVGMLANDPVAALQQVCGND